MRAIEGRVSVVRSANRGAVGLVDPTGRASWSPRSEGIFAVRGGLYRATGPTAFVRLGDVAGTGSTVLAALLLAWAAGRMRGAPARGTVRGTGALHGGVDGAS